MKHLISIILPIHNGETWIDDCFNSILNQTVIGLTHLEVCVCNDSSTDSTTKLLNNWYNNLETRGISLNVYDNSTGSARGVGYAKNRAVEISKGEFLCFQDVDDVMLPDRILYQYKRALAEDNDLLIGCKFKRNPENSTTRYTNWANNLSQDQLNYQVYTSNGPTVIMPTWFCHRLVFNRVRGFSEEGHGIPEDLIFFYKHLDVKGKICRVDECLLIYTFHPSATTFTIHEDTIWQLRIQRLETSVLSNWPQFTIWNAGKQGRKLFNSLNEDNKNKVAAMCDINEKLIGTYYTPYDPKTRKTGRDIKIVHFREAVRPFVICVKLDMTNGEFENNLKSLQLEENVDFVYFS